jgi:hypothetical protein
VPAAGARTTTLDHTAVFHRGPEDLARQVAGPVAEAIGRDEAVLLSVDADTWGCVGDALGGEAARVRWMPAGVRSRS